MEFLRVATAYLSTKIEGGGDVETLIQNGKLFEPAWPDPVGPTPEATKAMLQAEYGTRAKRVEKLWINLSTAYGLVIGQCNYYIRSRLKGQDNWDRTSNDRDLLELLKSVKSLSHKYDEDTEYHHVAHHTLLRRFMLFCQGDSSNSEYIKRFKDHIDVLGAYNGRVLFRNSPVSTARELTLLGLNTEIAVDVEKAHISAGG